jgi:Uma2 family endonuclease
MATSFETAPELTLADLLDRFGPIAIGRIRQDPLPGTATEDDLERILAREMRLYELVDGILLEKVKGYEESELTVQIIILIGLFVREHGLGIVTGSDGLRRLAPGLIRIPDIAFVSWKRLNDRRPPAAAIAPFGPELAIEVLSKGNTKKEMADKLVDYFASGTRLVWYIDPRAGTVTVHEPPDRVTVLRGEDRLTGGEVLPGFEVTVTDLLTVPESPDQQIRGSEV